MLTDVQKENPFSVWIKWEAEKESSSPSISLAVRVKLNVPPSSTNWFSMSDIPDIHCHVFTASEYSGEPTQTEEAIPLWFPIREIPWERMWEDDQHWLPQMLEGQKFLGKFIFDGEKMLWKDVVFGESAEREIL